MTNINGFRKEELKVAVKSAFDSKVKTLGVTTEAVSATIAEVLEFKTLKNEEEKNLVVTYLAHLVEIKSN